MERRCALLSYMYMYMCVYRPVASDTTHHRTMRVDTRSGTTGPGTLLVFGAGFIGSRVIRQASASGFSVLSTTRQVVQRPELSGVGAQSFVFDGRTPLRQEVLDRHFGKITHVLSTVPPLDGLDPVLEHHARALEQMPSLCWLGHLSTAAVYGEQSDIDATSVPRPSTPSERVRMIMEHEWTALAERAGKPMHIFRPASVYGPWRGPQQLLREGNAVAIERAEHVSSRIHVDDVASAIVASMKMSHSPVAKGDATTAAPASSYLLADGMPASPSEVLRFAASTYGRPPPQAVAYEDVAARLSAPARSFWGSPKRISAETVFDSLGVHLAYPTYREGLEATCDVEGGQLPPLISPNVEAPPASRTPAPASRTPAPANGVATAGAADAAAAAVKAPPPLPAQQVPATAAAAASAAAVPTAAAASAPAAAATAASAAPKSASTRPPKARAAEAMSVEEVVGALEAEGWSVHGSDGPEGRAEGAVLVREWVYETRLASYKALGRIVASSAYKAEWVQPSLRYEDLELRVQLPVEGLPAGLAKAARFIAKKAEPPQPKGSTLLDRGV